MGCAGSCSYLRPAAAGPAAAGRRHRRQVAWQAGCPRSRGPKRQGAGGIQEDTAASPPRNPQSPQHRILGLVVLGSSRGWPASSRKASHRGDEELHFPEGWEKLGSQGKRPGRRCFPGVMGPVLGASVCSEAPEWSGQWCSPG